MTAARSLFLVLLFLLGEDLMLCSSAARRPTAQPPVNQRGAGAQSPPAERPVLLFAYFLASSMSVHLAYSRDGLRFAELNGGRPVLCARRGNWSTIRDPYLQRAPDGQTFHLVASAGNFGYADRFHYWNLSLASGAPIFSNGTTPEVMAPVPAERCVWAPEWVYDAQRQQYLVFWASTSSHDVNNGAKRIWGRWTPNFASWPEPPFVVLDPGFDAIDADALLIPNGTALLFFKDERGNCCHRDPLCPTINASCPRRYDKTVRRASSPSGLAHVRSGAPAGEGFSNGSVTAGVTPQLTEGPEIVEFPNNPTGQKYLLYADCFMDNHYSISSSDDLTTFTAIPGSSCTDYGPSIRMPGGNANGSAAYHNASLEGPR